jgi:hypothetical protein
VSAYDSTDATKAHMRRVDELLQQLAEALLDRLCVHDASKLESPEKAMFDEFTPKLRDSTYGSEEYKGYLKDMGAALQHHYRANRHHPEHFPNGVAGMTLIDVLEMLADWKAAGERHADGNMADSLTKQRERFGLSDQLHSILTNTARECGWL